MLIKLFPVGEGDKMIFNIKHLFIWQHIKLWQHNYKQTRSHCNKHKRQKDDIFKVINSEVRYLNWSFIESNKFDTLDEVCS